MSTYIENIQKNNYSLDLPTCDSEANASFRQFSHTVLLWMQRSKQRKQLARLDARMLSDIGISAEQAKTEINKPFWK